MNPQEIAESNLTALAANPYPGRIVSVGRLTTGEYMMVTAIMGRSANSRNRVYAFSGPRVFTTAADPSRMSEAEAELIIYNAMNRYGWLYVASNGDQTDTIVAGAANGICFDDALRTREYEPDAPNFTPRITAVVEGGPNLKTTFCVLRRAVDSDRCERESFPFVGIPRGIGYYICTYETDGSPLPAFRGSPRPIPFTGTENQALSRIWDALNRDNRVAIAGQVINAQTMTSRVLEPINRFK